MKCKIHNNEEAVAICVSCGQPLCHECDSVIQGKHYCEKCGEKVSPVIPSSERRNGTSSYRVNGFLWFIFSLIPGAGHMYMGFMKRGVILLAAFLGAMAFDNLILFGRISDLVSLLIYVYAFFDSLSIKKALERGERVRDHGLEDLSLEKINLYHVGVIIIILGVVSLVRSSLYMFGPIPALVRQILYNLEKNILPILLIIGGIWLIRRSKEQNKQTQE